MSALARGRRVLASYALALRARPGPAGAPRVFYGHVRVPSRGEATRGPYAKLQRLAAEHPNTPHGFNVLYLASNALPPSLPLLLARAPRVVVNQDGVAYPAWHGGRWQRVNARMARALHAADHVVYQSEFSKASADHFLGAPGGRWEVLPNAVDTEAFTPHPRPARPLTLLLGGDQYQRYRFEAAVRTLALLPSDTMLLVSGDLCWSATAAAEADALVREAGVAARVQLVGRYAQADAASLYRRADILLHTKVNDPCPNVVLEALACGLPVVHSHTGGTPELVGDAGAGVPGILDWEREHPPDPEALAAATLEVAERLDELAATARRRAVELFDVRPWLERHRLIFEALLA